MTCPSTWLIQFCDCCLLAYLFEKTLCQTQIHTWKQHSLSPLACLFTQRHEQHQGTKQSDCSLQKGLIISVWHLAKIPRACVCLIFFASALSAKHCKYFGKLIFRCICHSRLHLAWEYLNQSKLVLEILNILKSFWSLSSN